MEDKKYSFILAEQFRWYELDDGKLKPLLELKYTATADAKKALGDIPMIRELFIGFQGYLYDNRVV